VSFVGSDRKSADRILPRYAFEARIKIEVVRGGRTVTAEGWVRDLSESGLGAFAGSELILGELATLKVPLPNQFELAVPATVTRAIGTQYGFQFTALSGIQRERLRKVLARCKPVIDDFKMV
jgi:PilZ domain